MQPFDTFADHCFYGGVRYEAYGTRMRKQLGSSNLPWGLPKAPSKPTLTPGSGGNIAAGTYQVHCVGVTETGYKGMPYSNTPQEAVVAADGTIAVTDLPVFSNPEIRYVAVYRTTVGTVAPFYYAGRVENGVTSLTLNGDDASLPLDDLLEPPDSLVDDEGAYAGPFRYGKPPAKTRCFAWDGRTFVYGEYELSPGAVTAVEGSDTMTFTGGITSEMIGKSIVIDGEEVGYNIASVISATAIKLDQAYVRPHWRTSDPVGLSCRIVGNPFLLSYSESDAPDYFPWTNAINVGKDDGGTLTAHAVHLNEALLFTEANIFSVFSTGNAVTPYASNRTLSQFGCSSPRSVVSAGGAVYFFSGEHFCVYSNNNSVRMDHSLGDMVDDLNPEMIQHIKGCKVNDRVYWGVATGSSAVLNEIWVYDTRVGAWDFPWTNLRFVDLESIITYHGDHQLWIETVAGSGYALHWFDEAFLNDGLAVADYSGAVVSATSMTLTGSSVFPTTGGINLAGIKVGIISGTGVGQVRFINTNTADMVTITEPWDVIPDATSIFTIGKIDDDIISGLEAFTRPNDEKTFMHFEIGLKG